MAGIPMLSGWADGLSSLPDLGKNLANIINPNNNIQQLFKQKVATDPNFLQQVANNPEAAKLLGALGFGNNIQNSVSAIPENAESLAASGKAKLYTQAITDPNIRPDAASVLATGQTNATLSKEKDQAAITNATKGGMITGINASNQKLVNDLKLSDQNLADTEAAVKAVPNLAGIDLNQVAHSIVSGQGVPANVLSRIAMDPGATTALKNYQDALLRKMEMNTQRDIASIRHDRPQNQMMYLNYVQFQQKTLNDQLAQADAFLKTTDAKQEIIWQGMAKSKDPEQARAAQQNLQSLQQARAALAPDSPLHTQLNKLNSTMEAIVPSLMAELGAKTGLNTSGGTSSYSSTASKTSSPTPIPLTPQGISGFVSALKTGQKSIADLDAFHNSGGISDADYQAIVNQANGNTAGFQNPFGPKR